MTFNGSKIADPIQMRNLIAQTPAGTTVPMEVVRNGKPMKVEARLSEVP